MHFRPALLVVLISACSAMVGEVTPPGSGGGAQSSGGGSGATGGGSASTGGGSGATGGGSVSSGGGTGATGGGSASVGGGSASTGGGAASTGGGSAGKVPIFIAQGGAGRLIISCDDGHTWVGNHAWDTDGDALMCGQVQTADCYNTSCSYEMTTPAPRASAATTPPMSPRASPSARASSWPPGAGARPARCAPAATASPGPPRTPTTASAAWRSATATSSPRRARPSSPPTA